MCLCSTCLNIWKAHFRQTSAADFIINLQWANLQEGHSHTRVNRLNSSISKYHKTPTGRVSGRKDHLSPNTSQWSKFVWSSCSSQVITHHFTIFTKSRRITCSDSCPECNDMEYKCNYESKRMMLVASHFLHLLILHPPAFRRTHEHLNRLWDSVSEILSKNML